MKEQPLHPMFSEKFHAYDYKKNGKRFDEHGFFDYCKTYSCKTIDRQNFEKYNGSKEIWCSTEIGQPFLYWNNKELNDQIEALEKMIATPQNSKYKEQKGWVKAVTLDIPPDRSTNTSVLSDSVILDYANRELESKTNHFVWVDIDRQRVYVLKGETGNWSIEKRIVCATGRNKTPTVRGTFEIGDRGQWFYSERLNSGAMYWVRFEGSYLFHSVAMDKDKNIVQIDTNINNTKYLSDITFSSNDIALNTLLSILPRTLEIHIINKEDEFINTLKLIFDGRIKFCSECNICKTYKMINNVKISK